METKEFNLTEDDFLFLDKVLRETMGYKKINQNDSSKTFIRLNLSPPRRIVGRETSYKYTNNGYTVILHTTYLEDQKKWRENSTDVGWNLIAEGDKAKYFARPFQRKKGFVIKFLRYAWISKWKIDNRPLCPECHAYMDIHRKTDSRQYFWICKKIVGHPAKPIFLSWDYKLGPAAKKFLKIRRDYTERYNAKNKKTGKNPKPAATIRKKWIVGNTGNIV